MTHRPNRREIRQDEEQGARERGPELVDVAFARFRYSQAQKEMDASNELDEKVQGDKYRMLRASFEDANGKIIRERWGAYGPAGLVITERHSKWLGRFSVRWKQDGL